MSLPARLRRPGTPDFIGVGAERCGGEWWFAALLAHPRIAGPEGGSGSLDFFRAFANDPMPDDAVDRYRRHFPRRRDEGIRGEWTARYLADGWTPPLLARVAPEARLLVMLRDPVACWRQGLAEHLAERGPRKGALMTVVADRVNYAAQLARLQRFFAPERILVLQYERCVQDPHGEYARTLRFLGADEQQAPAPPPPPPEVPGAELWPDISGALQAWMEPQVQALAARLPALDLSLWPNFAHLAAPSRA